MQKVIPAILTADPVDLRAKLEVLKDHTNWVHIDIMDGKFVPNTSVNLFELGEAYQYFNLDIHLMVTEPEKYFEDCKAIGAKKVIFHFEATESPADTLAKMEKYEFQKGIALNPDSPSDVLKPFEEKLNTILFMSIIPGFQGQEFIPAVLDKIKDARQLFPNLTLGMDGAIGEENIKDTFSAGIDYVMIGSRIWKADKPIEALERYQKMIG